MRPITALILLLPLNASVAQSYLEPTVPVIKQALLLRELTLGANLDTEFDDHVSASASAIMSPQGRWGFYVSGGPLLADNDGFRLGAGAAFTIVEPTSLLLHPAVEIHGGIGYSRITTDEIEDELEAVNKVSNHAVGLPGENAGEEDREAKITRLDFPLAVGLFWSLPIISWNVQPWLSPRVQIRRSDFEGASITTDVGVGASFGLRAALRTGLGFYVGGDLLAIDDDIGDSSVGVELIAGGFYILNLN